jgi:dipeptidyl aminopeptidase/acylaminoacyl peptidase
MNAGRAGEATRAAAARRPTAKQRGRRADPRVPRLKASLFFATRPIHGFDLSPDGERVALTTTISGYPELWTVPVTGGWPDQLTFDRRVSPLGEIAWSPDGKRIAYMADRDGDESFEIHAVPASGGEPEVLVAHPGRRAYLGAWHESGAILLSSNHVDPERFGIYRLDQRGRRLTALHEPDEMVFYVDLRRDGRLLAFIRFHHNTWHDLGVKDLQSGEVRLLGPGDGGARGRREKTGERGRILAGHLQNSEEALLCVSDHGLDRPAIARVDLRSGGDGWEWIEQSEHEIVGLTVSRDERVLLWQENQDGNFVVQTRNLATGQRAPLGLPPGSVGGLRLARDKRHVVVGFSGPRQPLDLHRLDPQTGDFTPITRSLLGGLRPEMLSEPEILHFKAGDGLGLTGLYFPPTTGRVAPPHRALVWIHGGPESQDTLAYNNWIQFFANQGYGVLTVNFRGSTGFGKAFQRLIYRDWGGASYNDILAGVDHLINRGTIDPQAIAVMGGSFGGYLTLWALTQNPDRWRVGVDIFGPSNLETFVRTVPEFWREATGQLIGEPDRDRELLRERSPITYVDRIAAPLLVVQGKNDPRVTVGESHQIVEAIEARGGVVEYLELENEGHGFSHVENKVMVMERAAEFIDRMIEAPLPTREPMLMAT